MTRRSRSSFDLSDALATAEALSPKPPSVEPPAKEFAGVPLVHFGQMPSRPPMAPEGPRPPAPVAPPPPSAPKSELGAAPNVGVLGGLLPKLGALLDWVRADGSVTRAIVVDDEGLPMVGMGASDLSETEGLFAATGSVASAMKKLALATPGALSRDFEGHVGDGPVLQLIGFGANSRSFVVAISRAAPLSRADVETVRTAFTGALEGTPIGASLVPGSGRSMAPGSGGGPGSS